MSAFEISWKIMKEDDYTMECYGCGAKGGYDKFGMGRDRKCKDCGSFEVHGVGAYRKKK